MNRPDPSDPDSLVVNKSSSLLAKTSFLESLNSKLQQQLSQTDGFPKPKPNQMEVLSKPVPIDFNPVNETPLCDNEYAQRSHDLASRVRNYINSRVVPDPSLCRQTLLDQIRRGTSLKKGKK